MTSKVSPKPSDKKASAVKSKENSSIPKLQVVGGPKTPEKNTAASTVKPKVITEVKGQSAKSSLPMPKKGESPNPKGTPGKDKKGKVPELVAQPPDLESSTRKEKASEETALKAQTETHEKAIADKGKAKEKDKAKEKEKLIKSSSVSVEVDSGKPRVSKCLRVVGIFFTILLLVIFLIAIYSLAISFISQKVDISQRRYTTASTMLPTMRSL